MRARLAFFLVVALCAYFSLTVTASALDNRSTPSAKAPCKPATKKATGKKKRATICRSAARESTAPLPRPPRDAGLDECDVMRPFEPC